MLKTRVIRYIALLSSIVSLSACSNHSHAYEFSPQAKWLNVEQPIQLAATIKPVLLVFITNNCPTCATLVASLQHYRLDKRLKVIYVFSPQQNAKDAGILPSSTVGKYAIKQPVYIDAGGYYMRQYRVVGWPSSFLIEQMKIKQRFYGVPTRTKIQAVLNKREDRT